MPEHVATVEPPRTLLASLAHLGPGMVLAGSIVGSGELIATTTTGARAGFTLLWLVVLGCVIKVPAQVEIGRATLAWGRTPLDAFDRVPGPRLGGRGWIYWAWAAMTLLILVQQGGIVAGVAQTLAGSLPLTAAGRRWNAAHDEAAALVVAEATARRAGDAAGADAVAARLAAARSVAAGLAPPRDEAAWCLITGAATAILLALGRYALIESVSLVLVGTFTVVTLMAVALLQWDPAWRISGRELVGGLVGRLPPAIDGRGGVVTALATFGIIGVGASELMIYPYWCLEKGYAAAVGPRDGSAAWAARARGWLRVMQLDAWSSMAVYTLVTVAFYLLGAATLGRLGLVPAGGEMVRTLGAMYAPAFGAWAAAVFRVGAFAVLYSTLFVAAAGNARMVADGLVLAGVVAPDGETRHRWTRSIAVGWALLAAGLAVLVRQPVTMVLASGIAQSMMLAAIGVAVAFFRWRQSDPRLAPPRSWDVLLAASAAGLVVVGLWTLWEKFSGPW